MPRMFDMLRRPEPEDGVKKEEKPLKVPPAQRNEVDFPKEILKLEVKKEEKKSEDYLLMSKKLISAVRERGIENENEGPSEETYDKAVEVIKGLLGAISSGEDINRYTPKVYGLLDDVFNRLIIGDNMLGNIYDNKIDDEYYLPYHVVNVLVLSSVVGLGIGFNKSRLSHLGMASIFCDVGMDALKEIARQPRPLVGEETEAIRTHISRSLEVVEKIVNVNDVVKEAIAMHHEKEDSSGYPRGMMGAAIKPYAKIIGLVDTYEAITHRRPYREGMNTHKAVRFLVGSLRNNFDMDVMKVFINKMSVYPIGSMVKLDTGETAKVISAPNHSPLRPVVMIILGANGERVDEKIVMDLSKQDFPSIKDPS